MSGSSQQPDDSRTDSAEEEHPPSPRKSAQALRRSLRDHLQARAALLGMEAEEAGKFLARRGALVVIAAIAVFFCYTLFLIAAVSLVGRWLEFSWPKTFDGIGWQIAALVISFLHLLLALALVAKVKRKPSHPLFEFTRAEFEKDRQWLDQDKNPSGNENDSSP